jgi:hypothetical protein
MPKMMVIFGWGEDLACIYQVRHALLAVGDRPRQEHAAQNKILSWFRDLGTNTGWVRYRITSWSNSRRSHAAGLLPRLSEAQSAGFGRAFPGPESDPGDQSVADTLRSKREHFCSNLAHTRTSGEQSEGKENRTRGVEQRKGAFFLYRRIARVN